MKIIKKFILCILVLAILNACSEKSGVGSNIAEKLPEPKNQISETQNSSFAGNVTWNKDISSLEESAGYTNNPRDGEGNSNEKTAEKSETIWDQYDIVYPASVEGYVIVQRGLVHEVKQGLLKENGEIVLPVEYDFISSDLSEGLLTVQKNTKFGAVNLTGETVIPIEYEYLSKFSEGLAAFKQNGLWGYLNKKMKP